VSSFESLIESIKPVPESVKRGLLSYLDSAGSVQTGFQTGFTIGFAIY